MTHFCVIRKILAHWRVFEKLTTCFIRKVSCIWKSLSQKMFYFLVHPIIAMIFTFRDNSRTIHRSWKFSFGGRPYRMHRLTYARLCLEWNPKTSKSFVVFWYFGGIVFGALRSYRLRPFASVSPESKIVITWSVWRHHPIFLSPETSEGWIIYSQMPLRNIRPPIISR